MSGPLEALYPNRCYDCLAVCPHDRVLCAKCEAELAAVRTASASGVPEGNDK